MTRNIEEPVPAGVPATGRAPLVGMSLEAMRGMLAALGEPSYRAKQLYQWVYARRSPDFEGMTSLSHGLRERLATTHHLGRPEVGRAQSSADGTRKYLYKLPGGKAESVLMPEPRRVTFCISSQAGCALDCRFCLTALMGFGRHLTPGEIVGQVLTMLDDPAVGELPVNVVFMGMGEPLHNYDNVLEAYRLLIDQMGIGIPPRRVTLSTAGMVPGILRLAKEASRPRLAISLNATTDEIRDQIMPINRKHPIAELLGAAAAMPLGPRERVTLEYVMLEGVNAELVDARRLLGLVRKHDLRAKVNLIPFNPGGGLDYKAPPKEKIMAFHDLLQTAGLSCYTRKNRGRDISAACGQLAVLDGAASAKLDARRRGARPADAPTKPCGPGGDSRSGRGRVAKSKRPAPGRARRAGDRRRGK
jgi:23S rRNA (adenine2503-C2)-methyltransferase